jgi:hypothetical protein
LITGEQREIARWGLLTADEALKANEIVATFDNLPEAMQPYLDDRTAEVIAIYRKAQPKADAAGIG